MATEKDETLVPISATIPKWLKEAFENHSRAQSRTFSGQLREAMKSDMEKASA